MKTRRGIYIETTKNDFSGGAEPCWIPIANCPDDNLIPKIQYLTYHEIFLYKYDRIKFFGCTCEDGCYSEKCECKQSTLERGGFVECCSQCGCEENCQNREFTKNEFFPHIEIKYEKEKCYNGFGVFAKETIPAGRYIGAYYGAVTVKPPETDLDGTHSDYGFLVYDHFAKLLIDSKYRGNFTRFINHSCDSNLTSILAYIGTEIRIPTPVFITNRIIESGEQLTIDYGDHYFENLEISCKCGYNSCRFKEDVQDSPSEKNIYFARKSCRNSLIL